MPDSPHRQRDRARTAWALLVLFGTILVGSLLCTTFHNRNLQGLLIVGSVIVGLYLAYRISESGRRHKRRAKDRRPR